MTQQLNLKVGDVVKVTARWSAYYGKVFTIAVEDRHPKAVTWYKSQDGIWFSASEIERK